MGADVEPTKVASWGIGDLAQASGLSVRVLRHWEMQGLIASTRTSAGHRRYGPEQVTRLYRALALRRTGLGLSQIAAMLTQLDPTPEDTLRTHLSELDDELRRRSRLRDRLAAALRAYDDETSDDGHGYARSTPADGAREPGAAGLLMKVIESMTMYDQYVHGYRPTENLRLHDQAGTLIDLLHDGTNYSPGSRVLEVGCGVGAQTDMLLARNPGVHITAIDQADDSLAQAKTRFTGHEPVLLLHADVYDLPHPQGALRAGTFDHVFVCFVLEHLTDPHAALKRLSRMLAPGGTITVIEGDHGSTFFHPDSAAARDTVAAQVALQRLAGGGPHKRPRLAPFLAHPGI